MTNLNKLKNISTVYILFNPTEYTSFQIFKSKNRYWVAYNDYPYYLEIENPKSTITELELCGYELMIFRKSGYNRKSKYR